MVHIKEFRLTAALLQATPEQVYDLFELVTYQGRMSMVVSNETKTNFFTAPTADYIFDPDNATATLTTAKIEEYLDNIGEEAILLIFDSSLQESPNTPNTCLLYTSPSPRDRQKSRMPSSA